MGRNKVRFLKKAGGKAARRQRAIYNLKIVEPTLLNTPDRHDEGINLAIVSKCSVKRPECYWVQQGGYSVEKEGHR